VAHNIAVDEHRRAASALRTTRGFFLQQGHKTDDLTPDRILMAKERLSVLRNAIQQMPTARRQSLLMNRLQGLCCAEIARRTGYSETAVKKHIAIAMMDLDRALSRAESAKFWGGGALRRDG
jgi:RNA polymerase sigma-70 factor (ECF subfamily)